MASGKKKSKSNGSSDSGVRGSESPAYYVLCIRNDGYPASLELRKVYKTMPDPEAAQHGLLRVVDESAEDYLYPQDFFVPISLPKAAEAAFSGI